jgi:hypothetical protein
MHGRHLALLYAAVHARSLHKPMHDLLAIAALQEFKICGTLFFAAAGV